MKRMIVAAILGLAAIPAAHGQQSTAPQAPPAQQAPAAPQIAPEAMEAARALAAYQRGQTMQRNAAGKLCQLGQRGYCAEAQAPAPTADTGRR